MCQFRVPTFRATLHGVSVAQLACAPTPPNITRVPNHMKYLNIEPHNVQAIVWWLAATLGCSVPNGPSWAWGRGAYNLCFVAKSPFFSDAALRPCMQNLKPLSLQLGKAHGWG